MPMGKVSHLAEKLVVIQALPGTPPFDEGTVLWTKEKKSIAKVCHCDTEHITFEFRNTDLKF